MKTILFLLLISFQLPGGQPLDKILVDIKISNGVSDNKLEEVIDYKLIFTEDTTVNIKRFYKINEDEPNLDFIGKPKDSFEGGVDIFYMVLYFEYEKLQQEIAMRELEDVVLEAIEVIKKSPLQKEFNIEPPVGKRPLVDRIFDKN